MCLKFWNAKVGTSMNLPHQSTNDVFVEIGLTVEQTTRALLALHYIGVQSNENKLRKEERPLAIYMERNIVINHKETREPSVNFKMIKMAEIIL